MGKHDLETVLRWRNHPEVRKNMLSQHEISMAEHCSWFSQSADDASRALLVVEENGLIVGCVVFSNVSCRGTADWSFYIAPHSPRGSGLKVCKAALDFAFKELQIHKVAGLVLDFNVASIRTHLRLGFTQEGTLREHHLVDGKHMGLIVFGLLSSVWQIQNKPLITVNISDVDLDIQPTIVFASCKSWHKPFFENLKSKFNLNWIYLSTPSELEEIADVVNPKYIFFLHWNWIVPERIWIKHECVCFHMTDVPYGRGGSPLQNLILAGHKETKLTALRMVREIDAGPIYTKKTLQLEGTAQEIYVRAGALSVEIIEWMIKSHPVPVAQEGEIVLFKRRMPQQSRLPETGSLVKAYDFIRMLDADGYPPAFIEYGDFVLKLSKAKLKNGCLAAEVEIDRHS